jgi:hypothetical protein
MSNKTDTQQPKNGVAGDSVASVPAFVDELLKNGTTTLISLTRDDLGSMLKKIPADVKYSVGAVGFNQEVSEYSLRVDIIKL